MKKNTGLFLLAVLSIGVGIEGFAQTVTNNNSITINGDVYYFRPSTTPSSPQPKVGSSNFISYGRWYGADAAKAWASIAGWAIEHCERATDAVTPDNSYYRWVYISSVEARESGSIYYRHEIVIYYWVVAAGEKRMEDGRRVTRSFYFK